MSLGTTRKASIRLRHILAARQRVLCLEANLGLLRPLHAYMLWGWAYMVRSSKLGSGLHHASCLCLFIRLCPYPCLSYVATRSLATLTIPYIRLSCPIRPSAGYRCMTLYAMEWLVAKLFRHSQALLSQ